MKEIVSHNQLLQVTGNNKNCWLLLFKGGSELSDCAYRNFADAAEPIADAIFLTANVNEVRDIHPSYGVTSVPSLLQFRDGNMVNLYKGCHQPEQFRVIFKNNAYVAVAGDDKQLQKKVVVYSTPTCSWCTTLKRHLDANRVRYKEIDVSKDHKSAEEMVRKSGQQGVPQTEINGQVIVGFDRERINKLLGIN